ncbi:MAG: uncharacterized protein PWP07_2477 [Epulopiscium sp.]|uniref:DUF47 family protein n=1 Tax=Defluviitalea raffinosedens TaxID=1450156 RepID=A0A7C8LEH7_9FIRM|nr:DUF47 family protein [Defluviitalea raffinosedens]MBZ4668701.1 phosphate transport regulator [Defluviitaleaceae bacterium]MDK2789232.1 uncharacterized protein [Candidatus Epulonipiscium sp.]KAE9634040.1 DUF47 family protein [Defluviitalea raffinosedens]MBM7685830.1 putative phosphate transport protein (TIGR00153 family) [Defluviitalea raffinosedens]HHW67982.1 DUF47 family protein [Candidatus Epulonipiscium sp.]
MPLFKKEKKVLELMNQHIEAVIYCNQLFIEALEVLNEKGTGFEIERMAKEVGEAETEADHIRHEIIHSLLKGVLLPESRREILNIIKKMDDIANKCEEIIKQIYLQNIEFFDELKPAVKEINLKTKLQLQYLQELINKIFGQFYQGEEYHNQLADIVKLESEIDEIEYNAIRTLFNMDIELAKKNQIKAIISDIAELSDIGEDISDMLEMIMVLRKV